MYKRNYLAHVGGLHSDYCPAWSSYAARRWVAGVLAGLAAASTANAYTADYWNQPAGGSWDNPANWSAGQLPGAAGDATFNLASASPYTVTLNSTTQEYAGALTVQDTNVVIDANATPILDASDLTVTASAGGTAEMTFNGQGVLNYSSYSYGLSHLEVLGYGYEGVDVGAGAVLNLNNVFASCEMIFGSGAGFGFDSGSVVNINNSIVGGSAIRNYIGIGGIVNCNGSGFRVDSVEVAGSPAVPAVLNLLNSGIGGVENAPTLQIGAANASGTANFNNSGGSFGNLYGPAIEIGALNGAGVLNLSNGGNFSSDGEVVIGVDGPGTLNLISGNYFVEGQVLIGRYGVLREKDLQFPAGYPASYLQYALNLSSGSVFDYVIDNKNAATLNIGDGPVYLNGTLVVTFDNGFDPTAGESFQPFSNFNTESGSFATINLPPLDPGLGWDISQLYKTGTISVVAVPEPSVGLLMVGLAMVLRGRGRGRLGAVAGSVD